MAEWLLLVTVCRALLLEPAVVSFRTRRYRLRVHLPTWCSIGAYVVLVAYHVAFVQTPGEPGLVTEVVQNVEVGPGHQLIALEVLPPDGTRALAGVRSLDGSGALWLLDWTKSRQLVESPGDLLSQKLAETAARAMPKQASYDAQRQVVEYVTARDGGGLTGWTWQVGVGSRPRPLPPGYLFTTRRGQDVTVTDAERSLAEQGLSVVAPRVLPGSVVGSGSLAIVRLRDFSSPPGARDDDFYAFDRTSGGPRAAHDTNRIFHLFSPPRFGGVFYTHGTRSWLSSFNCDAEECWDVWSRISTDGATIDALDYHPKHNVLALGVTKGQSHFLMVYEGLLLDDDSSTEHATYLGSLPLSSKCTFVSLVDARTVVVGHGSETQALTFSVTRGGLVH